MNVAQGALPPPAAAGVPPPAPDATLLPLATKRASMAGSVRTGMGPRQPPSLPEFEFNLTTAKSKALKAMEGTPATSAQLTHFIDSGLFDRLARPLLLMFAARFEREGIAWGIERMRQQHQEGSYSPQLAAARLRHLEEDEAAQRLALGPPYAELILRHSSFRRPQRDRRFFEGVYSTLEAVLNEAFARLGREAVIATELGAIFRGPFNAAARQHRPRRSVDTLSCEQLWALKFDDSDGGNRALRGKLIQALNEKPSTLHVQVAALSNTPLVTQAVTSPIVARGLLADPATRDALLAPHPSRRCPSTSGKPHGSSSDGTTTAAVASWPRGGRLAPTPLDTTELGSGWGGGLGGSVSATPATAGGRTVKAAGGTVPPTPSSTTAMAAGLPLAGGIGVATGGIGRGLVGAVAPLREAAGLPLDESIAHLILLRRYVLHGPTFGLVPAAGPGAAATGAQGSMLVPPTPSVRTGGVSISGARMDSGGSAALSLLV